MPADRGGLDTPRSHLNPGGDAMPQPSTRRAVRVLSRHERVGSDADLIVMYCMLTVGWLFNALTLLVW